MYCKLCHKNVRSIAHWAREHRSYLHRHRKMSRGSKRGRRGHSARWKRMVKAIGRHGSGRNPYAIATSKLGKLSFTHHSKPGIVIGKLRAFAKEVWWGLKGHEARIQKLERSVFGRSHVGTPTWFGLKKLPGSK